MNNSVDPCQADPELLAHYEMLVTKLVDTEDSKLGIVLAALVKAYGGSRHMHMTRIQ